MNGHHFVAMAIAAGVGVFGTRSAQAAIWVMGASESGSTYTGVETRFTVPNGPQSGTTMAETSIWPGLQGPSGLLQAVLSYNFQGTGWTMHTEVAGALCNGASNCFGPVASVSPNDSMYAAVFLDNSNPGSKCDKTKVTNCNWAIIWEDITTGLVDWEDYTVPQPPNEALGLVLEATIPPYNSCSDFPIGVIDASVNVYVYGNPTNLYNVSNYLNAETPGMDPQFTNVTCLNGKQAVADCMSVTALNGNQIFMWLNTY